MPKYLPTLYIIKYIILDHKKYNITLVLIQELYYFETFQNEEQSVP